MRYREIDFKQVLSALHILDIIVSMESLEARQSYYLEYDPIICLTLERHRRATIQTKELADLTVLKAKDLNDPSYIKSRINKQRQGLISIKNLK